MDEAAIKEALRWQAAYCGKIGAPFSAAVLQNVSDDPEAWAAASPFLSEYARSSSKEILNGAVPLRLLGGFHYLVLKGAAPALARAYEDLDAARLGPLLAETARAGRSVLSSFMSSPPQTNEVGRSLCLFGGFLEVAKGFRLPLRCFELGASAGLNANWDRYAYALPQGRWGAPDAALTLSGDWRGGSPPLNVSFDVVERRACDQAPIDAGSEEGALRLKAYVWPEQRERMRRLEGALEVFRRAPVKVETADAAAWVRDVADPKAGAATVVYHSIFIQYPPEGVRKNILSAIREKGEAATPDAPFAWLRMEPQDGPSYVVEVRLTEWPGSRERRLAEVHPHGAEVVWAE